THAPPSLTPTRTLHDALPIYNALVIDVRNPDEVAMFAIPGTLKIPLPRIMDGETPKEIAQAQKDSRPVVIHCAGGIRSARAVERSEEHTSELQSRFDLVCRLL